MKAPSETLKSRSAATGKYERKLTPELHAAAHFLHSKGLSTRKIASRVGLHHATVARALRTPFDPVMWRALHDEDVLALAAAEDE